MSGWAVGIIILILLIFRNMSRYNYTWWLALPLEKFFCYNPVLNKNVLS